jgi:RHS repeat-associated protein
VTDISGNVTQHVEYVPFGEVFIEEHNDALWKTPYKFNGKELDEETGLYYYGARYYDPRVSLWLGVDPLAEKYRNVGGYVYCVENPVKFVDPDGMQSQISNAIFGWLIPPARASTPGQIMQQEAYHVRKNIVRYATPGEDIYGIFTGRDFDGNEYNRGTATAWAAIGLIPETKLIKLGKVAEFLKIPAKELKVVMYGGKHIASAKSLWKDVVESSLKGVSKFKNSKDYIELTKTAWDKGKNVANGKPWKVFEADEVIGAASGKETKYMRVELTESTKELHSSPITKEDYQRLLKEKK